MLLVEGVGIAAQLQQGIDLVAYTLEEPLYFRTAHMGRHGTRPACGRHRCP